jgi:hypothetical protein
MIPVRINSSVQVTHIGVTPDTRELPGAIPEVLDGSDDVFMTGAACTLRNVEIL